MLAHQVRVEGTVEPLSEAESDAYFAAAAATARSAPGPRGRARRSPRAPCSRSAARASPSVTPTRAVPRPPFWAGFLLVPEQIELWSGRDHRLHDRELFRRVGGGWSAERLYP